MTKYILFFIGCCILFAPLRSQNVEPIKFVHIGLNEGLSQSTIFGITQDKQGNMWFATYNGLNKYNGYDFTVYQHDEHNPHSISNDIIRSCTADRLGKIWIGTDSGLSFYNADKDRFENFSSEDRGEQVPINGIVEFNDHELLLFSNKKKLLLFNTETSQFSCKMPESSLESLSPTVVARQGDYIYIGSNNKVYTYSLAANTLSSFVLSDNLKDKNITAILQQSPTRIWIGTEGGGLFLYNPQTGTIKNYSHTSKTANCISSDYVRSLALDSQHRLWIGTINSLNIYNEQEDNFNIYTSDPLENGSLSQMSVRNIFMDTQGGMWLGTYFGGINYYHPLKNRFRNLQFTAKPNSLNSNIINCIREDAQKGLWIGTNGGGVNYYNPQTGKFTHYTQKEGLGSNDVKAIYIDEANKQVYIGTHTGGLSILHRRSGQIETYNRNSREKNIYAIEPTETGDFWMSGMSSILRFNPSQLSFSSITTQSDGRPFLRERVSNFFRDSKHRLWLISEKGLFAYTEQNGKLHNYPIPALDSISRKFINCLYEAHDGTFWIGTRSGICRLNEKSQEVTLYTTAHGLPNNVVHGILEDSYGKLWISTDKGISCLHPSTGKFRNFTNNDGLQSNQFTAACQRTADGQMYFGGINGITTFRPEEVVDNPYIPLVVITQLRLFNKIVFPDDETGILERNINETRSITFTAQQSMFSLEFVVSNYASGTHNTFAYKLDGYDKEWYYTNSQRVVSYSNLPQGTYRFLVKAANNDGKWNETPTELEIIILPAWYKTWWASLLFAAAFIAATVFVFRYFWIRKSMKAEIQMAQIDKERQKEVNEMKLRFFINISHELRTPLTLILAPLHEMLNKVNDRWQHKQLELMKQNATRLLHLVNQLLDYRKAELGVFGLKVKPAQVHRIIEKNFRFYEALAQRKGIQYDFCSEVEDKEILCDPNYLELIVNNLLSNAFKHTEEGQSITVSLKDTGNNLLLQVKDTGNGIPLEEQKKIFERFYQVKSSHTGSGIGLSLVQRLVELHHGHIELDSAEGVGSTFSIFLPIDKKFYRPEEFQQESTIAEIEQSYSVNPQEMYVADAEEASEEETEEEPEKPTKPRQKESILIVEDNSDIRQYLCEELGKLYNVLEAKNGKDALEIMKEQEINLILTDVMMPVMDGLQLCKQIKQNLNTCHIPVIILSAKADLEEQLEGLHMGADDYIPKPFSLTLVTTKIRNLFRTRYRAIQYYSNSLEIEPEKLTLSPLDEEVLKKAMEIMEQHLDDVEFSTEEFAREMCMSRSSLHLKMKALTGESTNDFIRKIRFNRACKLLKEGRYTVAEISVMVGFSTPSYFATSFKKYFGCLPSEYIKNK